MIKKKDLSHDDKKTWEEYVNNPSDIYDKDIDDFRNSLRRGRFKFDLHGFTLDNANKKVREIIFSCVKKKFKEILFITGKGTHSSADEDVYLSKDFNKLKFTVPEFIRSDNELNKLIISIKAAENKDGGKGAIIVKLKNL